MSLCKECEACEEETDGLCLVCNEHLNTKQLLKEGKITREEYEEYLELEGI